MRQLKITQSITNRESASLEKYLQDIGKEGMVTPHEEVELALTEALGRKVKITASKNKGSMEIEFYGKDDLTRLANILGRDE